MPIYGADNSAFSTEEPISLAFTYATHNPALQILRSNGYHLSIVRDKEGEGSLFIATAGVRRFAASGGAELLGLVTIWEHYGAKWNRQEPDLVNELLPGCPDTQSI